VQNGHPHAGLGLFERRKQAEVLSRLIARYQSVVAVVDFNGWA
jgi:hypothetical protein